MYNELIAELRQHHCDAKEDDTQEVCEECVYDVIIADKSVPSGIASVCVCGLMNRAADAIEELSRRCEQFMYTPPLAWIPVTERLPEAERKSYWVCTNTGYQCECRWTNNRFGIGESDEWGWSIFDIPQYQKVMAWMDLPKPYKPPKEEK